MDITRSDLYLEKGLYSSIESTHYFYYYHLSLTNIIPRYIWISSLRFPVGNPAKLEFHDEVPNNKI